MFPVNNSHTRRQCRSQLSFLYEAINAYGVKYCYLPQNINQDDWIRPFLEFIDIQEVDIGKILICPGETDLNSICSTETKGAGSFKSSYKFNTRILEDKWEILKIDKVPLLIEKNPNHKGKIFILYTNGAIEDYEP